MSAAAERPTVIAGITALGDTAGPVDIRIEDDRIAAIGAGAGTLADRATRRFDGAGLLAAPGYIDLQINGAAGHDLTTDPETVWAVGAALGQYGVTAFVPTLVSPGAAAIERARSAFAAGPPAGYVGATPLGWHVEGPYLSRRRAGAHDPAALRPPDVGAVAGWSPQTGIRTVTLAPELPGALDMVRALVEGGVLVSAGHSAATYAQGQAGFDAGIRSVTHLFNAMAPLDHREPGLAGAALEDPRVTVGLIPDGHHVHPALVAIVRRAVGIDRLAIVTDAIAALGLDPGNHHLAGRAVRVRGGSASLEDGTLAGSVISLDAGVRNLLAYCGGDATAAIAAVTSVPARLLGIAEDRGALRPGMIADVTLLTPDLEVVLTLAAGRVIHDATQGARWA